MKQEMQHWLGSNRPPRVQITYDVETLGATVKEEIPFIVGIIGDFAGGARPGTAMADRRFIEIDRDSFPGVMAGIAPALTLSGIASRTIQRGPGGPVAVPDGTNTLDASLAFQQMEDFGPTRVIQQITTLQDLMTKRQQLSTLAAQLGTSAALPAALATQVAQPAFAGATAAIGAADAALTNAVTLFNTAADAAKAADSTQGTKTDGLKADVKNAHGDDTGAYGKALTAAQGAITTWKGAPGTSADATAASSAITTLVSAAGDVSAALATALNTLHGITDPWGSDPTSLKATAVTAVAAADAAAATVSPAFGVLSAYPGSISAVNPATS